MMGEIAFLQFSTALDQYHDVEIAERVRCDLDDLDDDDLEDGAALSLKF